MIFSICLDCLFSSRRAFTDNMAIVAWSIVSWAPTATMGMEVNKLSTADMNTSYRRLSNPDAVQLSTIHLEHGSHEDDTEASSGSTGELSGIYFGILNSKLFLCSAISPRPLPIPPFAVHSTRDDDSLLLTRTNSLPDNTTVHRLIHQHRRLQYPRAGQEPRARDRRPPQRAPLHLWPQRHIGLPLHRGHRRVRRLRGHQEAEIYTLTCQHPAYVGWRRRKVGRYTNRLRGGVPLFLMWLEGRMGFLCEASLRGVRYPGD